MIVGREKEQRELLSLLEKEESPDFVTFLRLKIIIADFQHNSLNIG